ncbi:hypothetical protein [uncultured Photobacterium sp.]|uniref:hypothetical protein n=1 Tax=uncultured Photobacterium sp. TaxID=173973 RepID=UPI00260A76E6|nr:hypothetical protein [uncultured Photobacterium sp.]
MSSQLKRVNYSIYLNPVNSLSDRYAVAIMQKWVNERKDMLDNPEAGMDLHNSLHMHKNIYLSGMFLHLLSPALAAGLSSCLGDDTIKMATLKQHLDACGLVVPMAPGHAPEISRQDIDAIKAAVDMTPLFNEIQSLRDELRQTNEDHLRHASQSAEREQELLLNQQKTQQELAETRQILESQGTESPEHEQALLLSQQKTLQEVTETRQILESQGAESSEREQALLLNQQKTQQELDETRQTLVNLCTELAESVSSIGSVPPAAPAVPEAPAVTEPASDVEMPDFSELQQSLTDEIRATNQKREIAELKALIKAQSELIKKLSVAPVAGAPAEKAEEEQPDLTETIANMQKVKKKGLW